MMNKRYFSTFLIFTAMQLVGCATERVTLLPQPDSTSSAVLVKLKTGESLLLNQPYMVAKSVEKQITLEQTNEADVNQRYKKVLDALPARAKSYTLPFNLDDSNLTPEALKRVDMILLDIKGLPAPELVIIGHTDARGGDELNDKLSQERAVTVFDFLKTKGIDMTHVSTVGRGSREPLIKNENGASEPRNRRVEIRLK
jgi:outer membrane protein OmpA-like peptidoglycan-associated protein